MSKFLLKVITLVVVLYASMCSASVTAKTQPKQVITIGVIAHESDGSDSEVQVGPFYGINLDYLTNIAKVLNLQLERRTYATIPALLGDIEKGKIDGAVGFSKTPEREKRFAFSEPFFSSTIAVWYREDRYHRRDPRELKWVCAVGTVYCSYLRDIGATDIHEVENRIVAFDEVRQGRANALVSTYVAINQYLDQNDIVNGVVEVPSWLNSEEVRFIASKDSQQLIDKIDKILKWERDGKNIRSVASKNPYHVNDKLLSDFRHDLERDQKITYSSSEEAFPFLFRNSHSGRLEGFLPDFIDLIQSRTGLQLQYVEPKSSLNSGLTAFSANLVPVVYVENPRSSDWLITKPFMNSKFVSVESVDSIPRPSHRRANAGILMSLKKQGLVNLDSWKEERFVRYENLKKLFSDLKAGVIDVAYVPDDIIHSLIAQDNIDGLHINESDILTLSISFAVSNNDTKLKKLLDSIIDTIDAKEIEKLNRSYRNFNLTYGYDEEEIFTIVLFVAVIFGVLLATIYFVLAHFKLKVNLAELNATNEEKEKQWLMEIIQEINSIVFIHSEDNQVQMTNCTLYQNKQCSGCTIKDSKSKNCLVDNALELQQVLSGKRIYDTRASSECQLGVSYVYRERKSIYFPSSKQSFVLTVLQDITEHKERESALLDAQEKAQAAVRARENFLATMSHELRTPLSAAHGLLDLLARKTNDDSSDELITQAMRSLNHLNILVDEVLDYSKLEAGQLKVTPERTNVMTTLCDVIRSFEAKANSKGLDYRVTFKPLANPWLRLDSVRLTQIATNLISNAVKFTTEGEVSVSINSDDKQLILKVADTGIGMKDEQLAGILQPFVQADDSITRKYGGTGLGLSIVDRLVECMGGDLNITSHFGLGTTIVVRLPIEYCAGDMPIRVNYSYASHLPTSISDWCRVWGMTLTDVNPNLTGKYTTEGKLEALNLLCGSNNECDLNQSELKYPDMLLSLLTQDCTPRTTRRDLSPVMPSNNGIILVAEDNPINQSVINMQLRELGITPIIVNNGVEAWEFIKGNDQVTLVLTDFHMPEMDGFELVAKLKSTPKLNSIPIVGITAEDSRLADERAKKIGIDDILYKPYDLEDLRLKLLLYLNKDGVSEFPQWISKFKLDDVNEIAVVFKHSMKKDVEQLELADGIHEKKRIIHRMKGALGAIGIKEILSIIIDLESLDENEFDKRVIGLINKIKHEVDLVDHWIEAHE